MSNEKLSLEKLPAEILMMIIKNLNQKDIAALEAVCQIFHSVISLMHKGVYYVSAINSEIAALGYKPTKSTNNFIGLPTSVEQCNFLNMLRKHKEIRDRLDLFEKIDVQNNSIHFLRDVISDFEKTIESILILKTNQKDSKTEPEILYLESCLLTADGQEFSLSSPVIFNPIMLRMYVEILRISAIITPNSKNLFLYKKLFLASILLLKVGDMSAYFSVIDILSMAIIQQHNILLFIKEKFNTSKEDAQFLDELIEEAFITNGINLKDIKVEEKKAFLKQFNYKLAFFYPQTTLTLLYDLLSRYGGSGLIGYYNISNGLLKCFDVAYRPLFSKIFDVNDVLPVNNLELLEKAFKTSSSQSVEILLTMAKHPKIFQRLSLEEILATPYSLIPILKKYTVYDNEHWNRSFTLFLSHNVEKLRLVASCLSYWSEEDISKLLDSNNPNIFTIIASCRHQRTLFSKLNYSFLEVLYNHIEDDKSLLQLVCESDNFLIIKALLEHQTDATQLAITINGNELLKKLLNSKNASLLLERFPIYFHQLRGQKFLNIKSTTLLMQLIGNEKFFLLVLKLSQGQYSLIEKNAHLIQILRHPLIYRYVAKHNLTFSDMQTHCYLFKLLFSEVKEASHIYLLSLPWVRLLELYQQGYLVQLLAIKSETLFAWVLFNVNVRPEYYQHVSREKLKMRKIDEIRRLLTSSILQKLDQFGFPLSNGFKNNFRHCDEELLRNLNIHQLLLLEKLSVETQSVLALICSINPCLVMMGIEQAKTNQKVDVKTLENFFRHPIWSQCHSSFSWMLLIYFDMEFLINLQKLMIDNQSIFDLLTDENNKNVFYLLINHCKTRHLLEDRQLFKAQNPPSLYEVNKEKFLQTVVAIAESGFLFRSADCEKLLKKFTCDEIQYLYNYILDSTSGKTYLDVLLQIAEETSDFEKLLAGIDLRNVETVNVHFAQIISKMFVRPQLTGYSYHGFMGSRKRALQEEEVSNNKFMKSEKSELSDFSLLP